ncbi:MAG: hypothetical protein R3F54_06295 [Alphaproteobacteria bacterium]
MRLFLMPGDAAASFLGLAEGSEHRQIFRMFANTVFWGLVGVVAAFLVAF